MQTKIGIFPASGGLGGSTYRHLLELVPNSCVTLVCRRPEKVEAEYKQTGVTVRRATYESTPHELELAFSGLDVLFLISYPSHVHEYRVKVSACQNCRATQSPQQVSDMAQVQLPAIDAARRAGVKHIFYSSLGFANDASSGSLKSDSLAVVMQAHLASEEHLAFLAKADPGFTYTSIREGLYSESFPIYTAFFDPKAASDGAEVTIPHDGGGPGVSWVKRDDLGEGSAKLIAKYCGVGQFPQQLVNGRVLLSGTREISLAETVKILGKAAGKSFKIRPISVAEYVKLPQVVDRFGDQGEARTWATAWEAIQGGEAALVTQDLEELLERKPEAYEKTVEDVLA